MVGEDGRVYLQACHSPHSEALKEYFRRGPERREGTSFLLKRRVAHFADVQNDPDVPGEVREGCKVTGGRAFIYAPMVSADRGIGTIWVGRERPGPFSEKEIALLQTFADQAVIAIQNARLFKETKEALEQQKASADVLGVISGSIADTTPVFDKILESCERLFEGHLVGVTLVTADGKIDLVAYHGDDYEKLKSVYPLPLSRESGSGAAILDATIGHYPDIEAAGVPPGVTAGCRTIDIRSIIFAPMLFEDRGIGAIWVGRRFTGPFTDKQTALLRTFADQAVIAIQNARLFNEIEEKSAQLETASRHKSDFLASMSHELRTPLNAILGFNEMILGQVYGEVPQDMKEPLDDIQKSGKHLLRLINNVLDLAKIEAGRMELALSDYSVQDTVESVRSTLRPLAAEKGLEFLVHVPDDIPLAYGDGGRIAQCLMNLAGNSLKFTRAGKVEISVEEKGALLTYRVVDTGIGIAPDKIDSLFTEFKQTDATIASEYGGTGLGLSISRKFVEMHGGRIWVESEPGRGSAFIFEIPLRAKAT
jgi:signal transduction histidine kinase